MNRTFAALTGAMCITAALVAAVSHADLADRTSLRMPRHSIVDVGEAWLRATVVLPGGVAQVGAPLPTSWIDFMTGVLSPSAPAASGGNIVIPGRATGTTTTLRTARIMPVASPSSEDLREAYRRKIGLEIFLNAVANLTPPSPKLYLDTESVEGRVLKQIPSQTRAAQLELYVIENMLMLAGTDRREKCLHHERAMDHATALGFKSIQGSGTTAAAPTSPVPAAWAGLEQRARGFYNAYVSNNIVPEEICAFQPQASKAAIQNKVKDVIDTSLRARFNGLAEKTRKKLELEAESLTKLETESAVNAPTAELFALGREVENASTLREYVSKDRLGLTELISRAKKGLTETESTALQQTAAGEQDLAGATGEVNASLEQIGQIVLKLRELPANAGLAQTIPACQSLNMPAELDWHTSQTLLTNMGECLKSLSETYKRLQDGVRTSDKVEGFASKVAGLSEAIRTVERTSRN